VSDVALVLVVVVVLSTVLAVAAIGMVAGQRVLRAYRDAARSLERGTAATQELSAVTEVTRRELEALGDRWDGLHDQREARCGR
jgi:hypothetical protein